MKKTTLFSILIALLALLAIGCSKHHRSSTDSGDPDANLPDSVIDTTAVTDTTTLNDGRALRISVISDGSTSIKLAKTGKQPTIGCPYGVDLCFGDVFRSEEFQLIVQNATDTAIRNLTLTQTLGGARAWVVTPGLIPVLDLPGKSSLIPIITVGIPHGTPLYKITSESYQWDGMDDSKGVVIDTLVFKWDGGEERYTMAIVARIARMHATAADTAVLYFYSEMDDTTFHSTVLNRMYVMGNCQVWDAGGKTYQGDYIMDEDSWIAHSPGDTLIAYPDLLNSVITADHPYIAVAASNNYQSECQHYIEYVGGRTAFAELDARQDTEGRNIASYNWFGFRVSKEEDGVTPDFFW